MWLQFITFLVLLTIAFELGWIVFKIMKSAAQSQKAVSDALDRLIQGQAVLTETTRDVAAKLANTGEKRNSLQTSDTKGLRQLEVHTAELLTLLQGLSLSVSKLQSSQAMSSSELSDRISVLLEQTFSRVEKSFTQVMTELRNDRQESFKLLKSQSDSQKQESKALVSLLLDALSEVRSPAKLPQSGQSIAADRSSTGPGFLPSAPPAINPTSANSHVSPDSKPSAQASNLARAVAGDSGSGSLEFETLQSWVNLNLPQIMNRSLNQWNKPEELFRGAPGETGYTARLLDPDSKLVLVSVGDTSQHLAIALPGGYIDPRYYEWFNLPKGIGARVERTMTPAIVDATDLGFRVLQRGLLTQD